MSPKSLLSDSSATPPSCNGLGINKFSLVFHNTTTSYKFLWALALIKAMNKSGAQPAKISLKKMAAGMLDAAQPMVYVFRLRLAKDDKMGKWLRRLEMLPHWDAKTLATSRGNFFSSKARLIPDAVADDVTLYPRHLFMSPFFKLPKGVTGHSKFEKIREMAAANFDGESPPPYRFTEGNDAIIVHPEWREYFVRNAAIINAWVMWHLARHVQGLNPNIPAVTVKLDETASPKTNRQKEFWRLAMTVSAGEFRCLYTEDLIDANDFALDHYVPWSFIAHDNMWNLVPVSAKGNIAKSNNLPCGNKYFDGFADMQHRAIKIFHDLPDNQEWQSLFESYETDLNLDVIGRMIDEDELQTRLAEAINPILAVAKIRGFTPDWKFN